MPEISPTMHPEVMGLTGGPKQRWLRDHHNEVKEYYFEHGPESTLKRYNMRQYTLRALLTRSVKSYDKMTDVDKALDLARVAIEGQRESRRKIRELEAQLNELAPLAQIVQGIIAVMTQHVKLEQARQDDDHPLSLADIGGKSGK